MPTKAVGRGQLCPSLRGTHQPSAKWLCTTSLPLAQAMWTAAWSNQLMDVAEHPRSDCRLCLSQAPTDGAASTAAVGGAGSLQCSVIFSCHCHPGGEVPHHALLLLYSPLLLQQMQLSPVCDSKKATLSKKFLGCLWLSVAPIYRQV